MNNTISPEAMASYEVLHTHNHASDSLSSEEFSFLPDIPSVIPNGDISHHTNTFDLTNMQSALGTTMPSAAEVHAQLLEIIEENKSLKEKLNKNNAMMKEQMATISAWREHMIAGKDKQEQSLLKAKEKIAALEKENAMLTESLSQRPNATKEEKILFCEKCTIFDSTLNKMLALDSFDNAESLLLELSYFREQLLPNLIKLCSFVEASANSNVDEENRKLLKTFELLLKFKIAALEGGNSSATVKTDEESGYEVVHRKSIEDGAQLRCDIEELKRTLNAKHVEICKLKKEKEELSEQIKNYESKIQEYEMALKSKFEVMNNKLDIESSLSEKYKERCESLQQQLEEYQLRLDRAKMSDDHVVKELREDIRNLQAILKLEQDANQEAKDKLAHVMLKCEKLQVDFDRVSKLLELELEKNKEITAAKENETKEFLSKIDELTAQFFEIEEQKRECEAQVRRLEVQLAEASEQTDDIPIFKQQIDEYARDFATIKDAHYKATEEAAQLKEELKKYERKCDSCPCSCNSSRKSKSGKSSDSKEQSMEDIECPFCPEKFRKKSEAERHIYRVHKEDDTLYA